MQTPQTQQLTRLGAGAGTAQPLLRVPVTYNSGAILLPATQGSTVNGGRALSRLSRWALPFGTRAGLATGNAVARDVATASGTVAQKVGLVSDVQNSVRVGLVLGGIVLAVMLFRRA